MVPNFALSLSFDGIALLRRAVTGWMQIDRVAFDDAELDQSLAALRDRATALSADGAQVLLVLPSEQVRFLDLADPGPDDAAREAAVRAALRSRRGPRGAARGCRRKRRQGIGRARCGASVRCRC